MAKIEIAKKLSMRHIVGGSIPKPVDEDGKREITLCAVVGIAAGLKHGESNYGPWTALLGNFKALPLYGENKGKEIRTGQLFLPEAALNTISPYVENASKGESIQFAFEIGVRYDKAANTGYTYFCNSLMEPAENDPLEALFANVAIPALEDNSGESVDEETGEVTEKATAKK